MSLEQRFWSKVDRRGANECWTWTAATNEHGYGVMRPSGRRTGPTVKAHRVSALLAGMQIDGFAVLHSCDNPPCVNPAHLRAGTQKDNTADIFARNRQAPHQRPKLTDEQIAEAQRRVRAGEMQKSVALDMGVSPQTMCRYMKRAVPPLLAEHVLRAVIGLE